MWKTVTPSYLRSCAIIRPKKLGKKNPENLSPIIFILLDTNRKREFLNMKQDCKPLPLILIMVCCVCLYRGWFVCLFVSMDVRGKPRMYCSLLAYCTARFDVPTLATRCPRAYRRVPHSSGGSWNLWAGNKYW
jgi:hypothetical protein